MDNIVAPRPLAYSAPTEIPQKGIRWPGIIAGLLYGALSISLVSALPILGFLIFVGWGTSKNLMEFIITIMLAGVSISIPTACIGGIICSLGEDTKLKRILGRIFLYLPFIFLLMLLLTALVYPHP